MPKTNWTRIAVEGATVDGRTIERNWIEEMATGFNPVTYTPRLNCEHLRGFSPEPPFNAYGSVVALRAVDVELQIDGKPKKLRALEAEIDGNDQLAAVVKAGQKIFTSIEVSPNFASTGKAGLVGLAITDNPASLGTEMLKFAASQGDKNPLAHRKQHKDNHFSAAEEVTITFAADPAPAGEPSWATALTGALTAFTSKFTKDEKKDEPEPKKAANDNIDLAALTQGVGEIVTAGIKAYAASNDAAVKKVGDEVAALTAKLESTANPQQQQRPPAAGGDGKEYARTDC